MPARQLVADGAAGLVTGHSMQPELTRIGGGFFASTGACAEIVTEAHSHLGLPPVFLHQRQVSWVEIEAGAEVHARLVNARVDLPAGTLLERLASGQRKRTEHEPAAVPPTPPVPAGRRTPTRPAPPHGAARATVAVALLGLLDLVSAVVPPIVRGRLHPLLHYVPLGISETATALARSPASGCSPSHAGIRRGQRIAWYIATGVLLGSAILHLVKNETVVQPLASLALVAYLVWFRELSAPASTSRRCATASSRSSPARSGYGPGGRHPRADLALRP